MGSVKIRFLFFFFLPALIINLFSVEASAEKRIGIFIFFEETRHNESLKGIMYELKKGGFGEPAVKFTIKDAKGSYVKASEMVKSFVDEKMDLIITLGTN